MRVTCILLAKFGVFDKMEAHVPSVDQIHDQVDVFPVLECEKSVYQGLIF